MAPNKKGGKQEARGRKMLKATAKLMKGVAGLMEALKESQAESEVQSEEESEEESKEESQEESQEESEAEEAAPAPRKRRAQGATAAGAARPAQRRCSRAQQLQEEGDAVVARQQQQRDRARAQYDDAWQRMWDSAAADREAFLDEHKYGRENPARGDTLEKRRDAMAEAYTEMRVRLESGLMALANSPRLLQEATRALHDYSVKVLSSGPVFACKGDVTLRIGVGAVADAAITKALAAPRRR